MTSELDKLTVRDKYGGYDQVQSASGAGMEINHIGSIFCVPHQAPFIYRKSFMFLKLVKIYYLSTALRAIMMLFLNFIHIVSLSRNRARGRSSSKDHVRVVFTR